MSQKIGRPLSENPKSERLYIRVTPEEKREIMEFCKSTGISILDLIKAGIEAAKKK